MKKFDKYKTCEGCDICEGGRYCFGNAGAYDQYRLSVTYEVWDDESADIGETDDRGYHEDRIDESYDSIHDLYWSCYSLAQWDGLSNHNYSATIYGNDRESRNYFEQGDTTNFGLHIERVDKHMLSQSELDELSYLFNL